MRKLTGTSGTPMVTRAPAFHPVFSSVLRSLSGNVAPPMMPKRTGLLTMACACSGAVAADRTSPSAAAVIDVRFMTTLPFCSRVRGALDAADMKLTRGAPVRHKPATPLVQEARMIRSNADFLMGESAGDRAREVSYAAHSSVSP